MPTPINLTPKRRPAPSSLQDEPRGATAERWRRQLLTSEPLAAFGPIQLQRLLKILSGRAANQPNALSRLFQLCASHETASQRQVLRALPQLADWWAGLEGARFLVVARLRSPYGGPAQTFESLERMLQAALSPEAAGDTPSATRASRERTRLLLHTFEHLERQIHNAYAGSLALAPPPRQASVFFLNNRRVCLDYFSRIRSKLL